MSALLDWLRRVWAALWAPPPPLDPEDQALLQRVHASLTTPRERERQP